MVAKRRDDTAIGGQGWLELLHQIRQPSIVVIENAEDVAGDMAKQIVVVLVEARMWISRQQPDARIDRRRFLDQFGRAAVRVVIRDEYLQVAVGLTESRARDSPGETSSGSSG